MHVLFLCSQNKRRSLTAEKLFDGYAGHQVRSAGTEQNARVKVTPGMLGWADLIFCMENKHLQRIRARYGDVLAGKTVVCVHIRDTYEYMDSRLCERLERIVPDYLR